MARFVRARLICAFLLSVIFAVSPVTVLGASTDTVHACEVDCIEASDLSRDVENELITQQAGLKNQRETEHFIFYCADSDKETLSQLDATAALLETCWQDMTALMRKSPATKTKVNVFASQDTFNRHIHDNVYPWWKLDETVGGGIGIGEHCSDTRTPGNQIYISDSTSLGVLAHELGHVIVDNPDLPKYLSEGMAEYLSGSIDFPVLYSDIKTESLLSLQEVIDLPESGYSLTDREPYDYGHAYIAFVDSAFGFDSVLSVIEGNSLTEVTGKDMKVLESLWREFLLNHYGNRGYLVKQTDYFSFYSFDDSQPDISRLEQALENCRTSIYNHLGRGLDAPIDVIVYPDRKSFLESLNFDELDISSDTYFRNGMLSLVDPANSRLSEDNLIADMLWYYTWAAANLSDNGPLYLCRGVAETESGSPANRALGLTVRSDILAGSLPTPSAVENANMSDHALAYAGEYISFIGETFGYDKVVSLLDGETRTNVVDMSDDELNQMWTDFLKSRYLTLRDDNLLTTKCYADGSTYFHYLTGFTVGRGDTFMSVGELKEQFDVPSGTVLQVIGSTNEEVPDERAVGTGMRISAQGADSHALTIVVPGDITGSGIMGITQLVTLAKALRGDEPLERAYLFAADLNENYSIDLTDLTKEAQLLNG